MSNIIENKNINENFSRVDKWYASSDSGSPATRKQVKQNKIHF